MEKNEVSRVPLFEEESVERMFPQLLKRQDVRHLLQISDGTLRRLIKEGVIRGVRIGASERFRIEDVRRLVLAGSECLP